MLFLFLLHFGRTQERALRTTARRPARDTKRPRKGVTRTVAAAYVAEALAENVIRRGAGQRDVRVVWAKPLLLCGQIQPITHQLDLPCDVKPTAHDGRAALRDRCGSSLPQLSCRKNVVPTQREAARRSQGVDAPGVRCRAVRV